MCARATHWLGAIAMSAFIAGFADNGALAQTSGEVPQFASTAFGWVRVRADGRNALFGDGWLDPPAGLRGPIKPHPDHPLRGNQDRGSGQVTLAFGNYMDPILKPWAADQMRLSNEEVLSGKRGMPFLATSRCYPGGVPVNCSGQRSRSSSCKRRRRSTCCGCATPFRAASP